MNERTKITFVKCLILQLSLCVVSQNVSNDHQNTAKLNYEPPEPPEPPEIEIEFFESPELFEELGLPESNLIESNKAMHEELEEIQKEGYASGSDIINSWLSGGNLDEKTVKKSTVEQTNMTPKNVKRESKHDKNLKDKVKYMQQPPLIKPPPIQPMTIPSHDISHNAKKTLQFSRGNGHNSKPVKQNSIPGTGWNSLFKEKSVYLPKLKKSRNMLNTSPMKKASSLKPLRKDTKQGNARVLFNWDKRFHTRNGNSNEKHVWSKKHFKPTKNKSTAKGVEFRFSDIISGFKSGKLFSIKSGLKEKNNKVNFINPFKSGSKKLRFEISKPQNWPETSKRLNKTFKSERKTFHQKNTSKISHPKRYRGKSKFASKTKDTTRKHDANRWKKRKQIRQKLETRVQDTIQNLMKNQMKLNVVKMLFDVEDSSEAIPFLMMGVAEP